MRFWLSICLCLLLPLLGEEEIPHTEMSVDEVEEALLSVTPEQTASFDTKESQLIGGVVSPLSGNLCLKVCDLQVVGAEPLQVKRTYLAPYMPYSFHKDSGVDEYYRSYYIIDNYLGWTFTPHHHLFYYHGEKRIRLFQANGAAYEFENVRDKPRLKYTYGAHNLDEQDIPSGMWDMNNTRFSFEEDKIHVFLPDGVTRIYTWYYLNRSFLTREVRPNGKVIRYIRTEKGKLLRIESTDLSEEHIYASAALKGEKKRGEVVVTGSTGEEVSYRYGKTYQEGKFVYHKKKREYHLLLPSRISSISSPFYKNESSEYLDSHYLLTKFSGKENSCALAYRAFGEKEQKHYRVNHLKLPMGEEEDFVSVYQLDYEPAVAGEKEGKTTVTHADGTKRVYHFSKQLLTTLIEYFDEKGELVKQKRYEWNERQWLSSLEVRGRGVYFKKSYEYDSFGNPIVETLSGDLTGSGEEESSTIKREFSSDHLILREETEEGKITTYDYIPNTHLLKEKIVHGFSKETYEYDTSYNLIRKTVDDGHKRVTEFVLRQEVPFLHMPEWIIEKGGGKLLRKTRLLYDPYGNVCEEQVYDANDQYAYSIYREYSPAGELLLETNPLGEKQTFSYGERGELIESTDFSQRVREEMGYDGARRLTSYKAHGDDGTTHTASYSYGWYDEPEEKTDTYQNQFFYSYDPLTGKEREEISPPILGNSVVTRTTYDALGRVLTKKDPNGHTTSYEYNAYGSPTTITYPDGTQDHFTYTKRGLKATHTNRDGLTKSYSYDLLDRIVSVQYGEDLGEERYTYNAHHLLESTDLEGISTIYTYDEAGRKLSETTCGKTISYTYDSLGYLSTLTEGDLVTHFARDLEGKILEKKQTDLEENLLSKIAYTYDKGGNLASQTRYIDGKKATEKYAYDPFGREILVEDPLGFQTKTTYEETRRLVVERLDPKNIRKREVYDPYIRIIEEETFDENNTSCEKREKTYDPAGNLIEWKEGGQCTRFTYTPSDQVETIIRGVGTEPRTTHYTYTPEGRLAAKILPDGTSLVYTYDPLGHLQSLTSSDGTIDYSFSSNKKGELLEAVDNKTKLFSKRTLDPFGNILKEEFPFATLAKEYDHKDRLTRLTLPDGSNISYTYDPLYLRKVTHHTTHSYDTYDLDGNLLQEKTPCGPITHKYDLKGRRVGLQAPEFTQTCHYDPCDNLLQETRNEKSHTYSYDPLSQLVEEPASSYSYDSLRNRAPVNSLNELETAPFDLNGNQTENEEYTYSYDPLHRMVEARSVSQTIEFAYDPLGRRVSKTLRKGEHLSQEYYLYHGKHEIGTLSEDGTLQTLRILGVEIRPQDPATISLTSSGKTYSTIQDIQGNLVSLLDPKSRMQAKTYNYSAFGEINPEPDQNPYRYGSKRWDKDLNLIHFGKRDYAPHLGRWLTPDPAGFQDSFNLYQYALNNPYRYYDPDGEFVFCICIPFAVLFTPAALTICAEGLVMGGITWATYNMAKSMADSSGLSYTPTESACYGMLGTATYWLEESKRLERSNKKHQEDNYPGSPQELKDDPDWKETTHPGAAEAGHRFFENMKTGEKVRFDKGKPGRPGHGGYDHYHRFNPKSKGDHDLYLDDQGIPIPDGHDKSHLYPPDGITWDY